MRDVMIIMPESPTPEAGWNLDIDIISGEPSYVLEAQNTRDQRAAISAIIMQGTIPGMLEEGINWGAFYEKSAVADNTGLVDIDNQVKQSIQNNTYTDGEFNNTYYPSYAFKGDAVDITINKIGD